MFENASIPIISGARKLFVERAVIGAEIQFSLLFATHL